ncbi:MAG: SDR family oxidoreductase [Verrucomicrobia bacterium]|nr:MAG: SDR family oxidoreductase [Verrucomicrobiota bacterium]
MSHGKFILLTGATRGLGRAMVDGFVRLGHKVVGCGRSSRDVRKLREQFGEPHDFYAVDVSRDDEVKSWASVVLAAHGAPDLVLNNAGLINKNARLWEIEREEFDAVIDVNIKGVANVIRHFAPAMLEKRAGVIVNFSSGWGRSADAEVSPYCASKWAVEGLTQSLAQELPSGMAVVALNPGIINTDMLRSSWAGAASNYPSAQEWATAAVPFLLKISASDNGKQLTVPIHGAND